MATEIKTKRKTHESFQRGEVLKSKAPRPPLRTLRELAEELGVGHLELMGMVNRTTNAPKALYRTGSHCTGRETWYEPKAFRKWFATRRGVEKA